jgi:hypothetical protein
MAELAAAVGSQIYSVNLTAASVARAIRLTIDSSNTASASAIGVRGDYISAQAGAASETIGAYSMQNSGIVPATASEAIVAGDLCYSAANGKVSKSSGGGAVIVGKANTAASGDGVLFELIVQIAA